MDYTLSSTINKAMAGCSGTPANVKVPIGPPVVSKTRVFETAGHLGASGLCRGEELVVLDIT
jgi:hypothetical protein